MKLKAIYTSLIILILSTAGLILFFFKKQQNTMKNSPIEFLYVNADTLNFLLTKLESVQEINAYIIRTGNSFKVPVNLYKDFFLKNSRVNVRVSSMLLTEIAELQSDNSERVFSIFEREVPTFLLAQISETNFTNSSQEDIREFEDFFHQLNEKKIYAIMSYEKKKGWFNYDKVKKVQEESQKESEILIEKLKQ